jgi:hypothetical protein
LARGHCCGQFAEKHLDSVITIGSVSREVAAASFPFLAVHHPGRRAAIRELTHGDPEFVFWILSGWRIA